MIRLAVLAVVLLVAIAPPVSGAPPEPRPSPRLVVILVVDQMRGDTLDRLAQTLHKDGGFAWLQRRGARFTDCSFAHLVTYTGPGHATILTGTSPDRHGIAGNYWIDRGTTRRVYCAEGEGPDSRGVAHLRAETLGDCLKEATGGRARVASFSWKDRAALFMGGRHADRYAWYSRSAGGFVGWGSQSGRPAYLDAANRRIDASYGRAWTLLHDASRYPEIDDRPFEAGYTGLGRTFPHPITGGPADPEGAFRDALAATPFADEILLKLALAAVDSEGLGRDEVPDLLAIGLSSADYVGHRFGPLSRETRDHFARLDLYLARFLDGLSKRVPLSETIVVLTGDHGVTPIPFTTGPDGAPDGGVRRVARTRVVEVAEAAVAKSLAASGATMPGRLKKAVLSFAAPHLYLRPEVSTVKVRAAVAAAVAAIPGLGGAAPSDALVNPQTRVLKAAALSHAPERGGDVVTWLDSRHVWAGSDPAMHGRPTRNDAHVPLIICAPGLAPGLRTTPCDPRDIAPSLAVLLGIRRPRQSTGRWLSSLRPF